MPVGSPAPASPAFPPHRDGDSLTPPPAEAAPDTSDPAPGAADSGEARSRRDGAARPAGAELPFTWPATLGGWLIGGGALAGAIFLIPTLDVVLNVLLFLALLAVAATVFLAERVPDIPRLRLITLTIVLVSLGVALDRAAFVVRGVESLFLVAMLAAAGGVLLVELDRDRPVPPPTRSGSDST